MQDVYVEQALGNTVDGLKDKLASGFADHNVLSMKMHDHMVEIAPPAVFDVLDIFILS